MTMELPDWLRGVLLIGYDGTTYRAIACKSSGELYAVLQGEYEGELTTVSLDAEGRISAFVIDSSDAWGQMLAVGNAELAARLNLVHSYDRRGQVLLWTDFSCGVRPFVTDGVGTGNAQVVDAGTWRVGGYSVKLTGGSDDDGEAILKAYFPPLPAQTWGSAVHICVPGDVSDIELQLNYFDGTLWHQAWARFNDVDDTLEVKDAASDWQVVASSVCLYRVAHAWHYFKLVVDFENDRYTRLLWGDLEIDISAHGIHTAANAASPIITAWITLTSRSGENDSIYVDSAVVTIAEPLNS